MRSLVGALLLVWAMAGCDDSRLVVERWTPTVKGVVSDSLGGRPLADVVVSINGSDEWLTDSTGVYLAKMDAGTRQATLTFRKIGYRSARRLFPEDVVAGGIPDLYLMDVALARDSTREGSESGRRTLSSTASTLAETHR